MKSQVSPFVQSKKVDDLSNSKKTTTEVEKSSPFSNPSLNNIMANSNEKIVKKEEKSKSEVKKDKDSSSQKE